MILNISNPQKKITGKHHCFSGNFKKFNLNMDISILHLFHKELLQLFQLIGANQTHTGIH